VELTIPEYGIGVGEATDTENEVRYFRVASNRVNEDWSVDLTLEQWPDGRFEDRFEFPAIAPRRLLIPGEVPAPVASGPAVITHNISQARGVTMGSDPVF